VAERFKFALLAFLTFTALAAPSAHAWYPTVISTPIDKPTFDAIRHTIPALSEVAITDVRSAALDDHALFVRVEDPRYCYGVHCLSYVVLIKRPSVYVSVYAANTVQVFPPLMFFPDESNIADRGAIAVFLTDDPSKNIKVFIGQTIVTVLP
jgi:hypothetical protein